MGFDIVVTVNLRAIVALALLLPAHAAAQTVYTNEIHDLPAANVFALLETAQPEVTTEQFNAGGLNAGTRDRASAFLASWTQTQYRLGDISLSSPFDGRPMMFLDSTWIDGLNVSTWHTSPDHPAPGLDVSMDPLSLPITSHRSGWVQATGSGGSLTQTTPSTLPPAVTELNGFGSFAAVVRGGASQNRLHYAVGASAMRSTTTARGLLRHEDRTASLFARGGWQVSAERTAQAIAWVDPGNGAHVQATLINGQNWRVYAGFTGTSIPGDAAPGQKMDRLFDGPIPIRAESTGRRESLLTIGARGARRYGDRHTLAYGIDVERGSASYHAFSGAIYELVDGIPARVWGYRPQPSSSRRHSLDASVFASDHMTITDRVTADLAMRITSAHGKALGASRGVNWNTLEPFLNLNWNLGTALHLDAFAGVSRVADRVRLNLLAAGDPNAEAADVYRWDGRSIGPLIAHVGPGTNGDASFVTIDPDLERVVTDEARLGLAAHPFAPIRMSVTILTRRQRPMINLVNPGLTPGDYQVFTIPDPNGDLDKVDDDQLLPVYSRNPSSFGADRFELTNPAIDAADTGALVLAGEWKSEHVMIAAGGTAQFSVAPGVSRGYGATENDQSLLGDAFSDPNAAIYARGQVFNDRAYTIKVMGVVHLPWAMTAGVTGRYQDGQPFARVRVVPWLDHGPDIVAAFGRGRSRFTFRSTVDVRLQKRIGPSGRFDLIAEVYNLEGRLNEVEEYTVTGPRFRETTAVQPPRSFHFGARVNF